MVTIFQNVVEKQDLVLMKVNLHATACLQCHRETLVNEV